jgi:ectoine hydroxylase-related dioxygenase (phytanoyl-CoA dioxygenase family)
LHESAEKRPNSCIATDIFDVSRAEGVHMTDQSPIEAIATLVGNHSVASVAITPEERAAGAMLPDKLALASDLFSKNGYIRIENLFSPDQMAGFDRQYRDRYRRFLTATNKPDKRPLFTVDIEGAFARREVIANTLVTPLLNSFLGEDFILAALSAVASFPGAPDQHLHRDATMLFGPDNSADHDLPTYSITMLVPLIDFTRETGCTRVWPGSQRIAGREEGLAVGSLDPEVKVGSVLITDGRVLHRGAANRSDRLRPLFYATFHRSWFRDFWGYAQRPPIQISDRAFAALPPDLQARVSWSRDQYKSVRRKYWLRKVLPTSLRMKLSKDI